MSIGGIYQHNQYVKVYVFCVLRKQTIPSTVLKILYFFGVKRISGVIINQYYEHKRHLKHARSSLQKVDSHLKRHLLVLERQIDDRMHSTVMQIYPTNRRLFEKLPLLRNLFVFEVSSSSRAPPGFINLFISKLPLKSTLTAHAKRNAITCRFWSNPFNTEIYLEVFWKNILTNFD